MKRLIPTLALALLSLSAAASSGGQSAPTLDGGYASAAAAAAAPKTVRAVVKLDRCWSRKTDIRIDFTGMPMTVCVDAVELTIPRNAQGEPVIDGLARPDAGQTPARLTATGQATHPGEAGEEGTKGFQFPLAPETTLFGRKTATGYHVWASVFVTDTHIGNDALVEFALDLDKDGRPVASSEALSAYITCPRERCGDAEEWPEVPFAPSRR